MKAKWTKTVRSARKAYATSGRPGLPTIRADVVPLAARRPPVWAIGGLLAGLAHDPGLRGHAPRSAGRARGLREVRGKVVGSRRLLRQDRARRVHLGIPDLEAGAHA